LGKIADEFLLIECGYGVCFFVFCAEITAAALSRSKRNGLIGIALLVVNIVSMLLVYPLTIVLPTH
jgi:hypothetical protein